MTMRPALALVLLAAVPAALVAGCGKSGAPTPAAGSGSADLMSTVPAMTPKHKKHDLPAGTPRPQDKLTVTLDGKPVAIQAALVTRNWDGAMRVTLSSRPLSCEEVTSDMREIKDDEVTFGVDVASALQPDGSTAMQLRQLEFGGMNESKTEAATGSGDATPGQSTTVAVDFTIQDLKTPPRSLVVKGTIDALGCTPATHGTAPPLPPEMPATMTIAGKTLPIRGAFLTTSSSSATLKLTTGSEGCTQVAFAAPGALAIEMTWFQLADATPKQIDLRGSLLGNVSGDQTYDRKKLTITPTPIAPGELTLQADIVVSKYPVKLAGKVTAVTCPK